MDERNKLYFIMLDKEINFSVYVPLLRLLSDEKQNRINRFCFDIDKKLTVVSDLFVRYLMCSVLYKTNEELLFATNIYGKPYIKGERDLHYSISHTPNAIAVATSRTPVGVDIERIQVFDNRIVERFFSQKEEKYIKSSIENQKDRFCEIWTKKESYVKWLGKGLSVPLNSFDVLDGDLPYHFRTFAIENYRISVCGENKNLASNCIGVSEKVVYEKILSLCEK